MAIMLWYRKWQLRSRNPVTRRYAVERLGGRCDLRTLYVLTSALSDADPTVRMAAARVTGKLPFNVRCVVGVPVGKDGELSTMKLSGSLVEARLAILSILRRRQDADEQVRAVAEESLESICAPVLTELRGGCGTFRLYAARALRKLGWKASATSDRIWMSAAAEQWGDTVGFGAAAGDALSAVVEASDHVVNIDALNDDANAAGANRIRAILEAMRPVKHKWVVQWLKAFLRNNKLESGHHKPVCEVAIQKLLENWRDDREVIEVIWSRVRSVSAPEVKALVLEVLRDASTALSEMLEMVDVAQFDYMLEIGTPEAIDYLAQMFVSDDFMAYQNTDENTRDRVVEALIRWGWKPRNPHEQVILAMCDAVKARELYGRKYPSWQRPEKVDGPAKQKAWAAVQEKWDAIIRIGPTAVELLVKWGTRELAQTSEPKAVRALLELARRDKKCARSAVAALDRVLATGLHEVTDDDLVSLASLNGVVSDEGYEEKPIEDYFRARAAREMGEREVEADFDRPILNDVDCSSINHIARQELGRRGKRLASKV